MSKALARTDPPSPVKKQQDDWECGLRALAEMIATAYRRRMAGGTDIVLSPFRNGEEYPGLQARTLQYAEPEDLQREGAYAETVKVKGLRRQPTSTQEVTK